MSVTAVKIQVNLGQVLLTIPAAWSLWYVAWCVPFN